MARIAFLIVFNITLLVGFQFLYEQTAAVSETNVFISNVNSYRVQHGVSALTESTTLDSLALTASQQTLATCSYHLPTGFSGKTWPVYGYETGNALWAGEQTDPSVVADLSNPAYKSIGVAFATGSGCPWSIIWTIILSTSGSSATPTRGPTPVRTAKSGDVDCNGVVTVLDALAILRSVALNQSLLVC